jgi:hypothetical protein
LAQKYSPQLAELAAIGFTDFARNVPILERYGGRMDRTVNALTDLSSPGEGTGSVGPRESASTRPATVAWTTASTSALTSASTPASTSASTSAARAGAEDAGNSELELAFQLRFTELVSAGLPAGEAAAQARLAMKGQHHEPSATTSTSPEPGGGPIKTAASGGIDWTAGSVTHSTPDATVDENGNFAVSATASSPAAAAAVHVLVEASPSKWRVELAELAAMGFADPARNAELLERYQGRLVRVINALAGGD